MPHPDPGHREPGHPDTFLPARRGWLERRRDKIAEEIARNRRGEYKVPTWVLATILVAFVAAWAALIIFA
ncbi:MAG: hypothetical protein GEV12_13075 [Micromonosporaceae bacterium]|nr:hypothetical protein [Micromonosporaceae bacterium]